MTRGPASALQAVSLIHDSCRKRGTYVDGIAGAFTLASTLAK